MSGEQIEYAIIAAGGLFGTLIGLGRIDIGLSASRRATMRWAGPTALIGGVLLLAYSFWQ